MEYLIIVITSFYLTGYMIGMVGGTNEFRYTTHKNISVGRAINTSMCGVYALAADKQKFHIHSDGYHIDPPCSIYFAGVNRIDSSYRFSGMCFKMSDIALPCGKNDTFIIRGWSLDIRYNNQSVSLYTNHSMLITEKNIRCESRQDLTMNYELCWEKVSMLEILFYSPYKPSSVLPTLTIHTRAIMVTKYPALSLHAMDTMSIQMSQCNCNNPTCRTCIPTSHDMYIEFLDRVITIGRNNDNNNDAVKQDIEEKSSSASVDLNILLPSLLGAIATVATAIVGAWKCNEIRKEKKAEGSSANEGENAPGVAANGAEDNQKVTKTKQRQLRILRFWRKKESVPLLTLENGQTQQ
ncbi:uncharacterized protein LOC134681688 [Mytilus trossulus]|uniref:uncharacterized protein LOC134681688 n=1 Tax=Mytilus trossulus TaxID=6551 RepID=UPI003004C4A4